MCDDVGHGCAWKPGGNFGITVPKAGKGSVKVSDAWDEAYREIQIEMVADDISTIKEKLDRFERTAAAAEGNHADDDENLLKLTHRAMKQLEHAVDMSTKLIENGSCPTSPELLAADRLVAAAQQRAMAMSQASSDISASLDSLNQ